MISTILLGIAVYALTFSAGFVTRWWFDSAQRRADQCIMRNDLRDARNSGWRAGHNAAIAGLVERENRKVFAVDFSRN